MLPRPSSLLFGAILVHGFAPPMPRVDRRSVSRHFDAASAAADILADPTARFEAATVVLLASFASKGSAEVKSSLHVDMWLTRLMSSQVEGRTEPLEARKEARETQRRVVRRLEKRRSCAVDTGKPVQ